MFDDILNLDEYRIMGELSRDEPELYARVQDGLRDGTVDWTTALTVAYTAAMRSSIEEEVA